MSGLAVTGGTLVDPATSTSRAANLLIRGGRIVRVTPDSVEGAGVPQLDVTGLIVAPGLIDVQVNGAHGVDITADPDGMWRVAAALPRCGVTSFLPTLVSCGQATRKRALEVLAAGRPADVPPGARPLGLHVEGPMLNPRRAGAHDPAALRPPSADLVRGWSAAAGVAMVTLAPELPGALDVIRLLTARGVVVSLGHTEASADEVDAAVAAGARAVTHLHNAMPAMSARQPGPVGAVLGRDDVVAGVIVDGHHVHPRTVAASWRALGSRRFLLVSDTTAALGRTAGRAVLGDRDVVVVADGAVRLADDGGTLAGSAAGLDDGVRRLVAATGCRPADALATATAVPAALIGRADLGLLAEGATADLVLLDPHLRVVATVVAGEVVADSRVPSGGTRR